MSARLIGAAVGIVMARMKLTYDAAFDVLAMRSQNQNTRLRDFADRVVFTGEC